jgi:hypothetical protein
VSKGPTDNDNSKSAGAPLTNVLALLVSQGTPMILAEMSWAALQAVT